MSCQSWPVVCFSIFLSFTGTEFPPRAVPSPIAQLAFRNVFLQVPFHNSSLFFFFSFLFLKSHNKLVMMPLELHEFVLIKFVIDGKIVLTFFLFVATVESKANTTNAF